MVKVRLIEKKHDDIKVKLHGKNSFSIGKTDVELGYVEQLLDIEQTATLSYCLKTLVEQMENRPQNLEQLVEKLWQQLQTKGLKSFFTGSYIPVSLAAVRKQEIYACVNRYRGIL